MLYDLRNDEIVGDDSLLGGDGKKNEKQHNMSSDVVSWDNIAKLFYSMLSFAVMDTKSSSNDQNQEVFSTLISWGSITDSDMTYVGSLSCVGHTFISLLVALGKGIDNGCWIAAVEVLLLVLCAGCFCQFTANIWQCMCMTTTKPNYCKHGSIFRATLAKMLTLVVLLSIVGQSSVVAIESIDIEVRC